MLMLNPAMASVYPIAVGSFLYARLDEVEQSALCCSAVSILNILFCAALFTPDEHFVAQGNMVLFLCQDLKCILDNGCIHLYVRLTEPHVNAYYLSVTLIL